MIKNVKVIVFMKYLSIIFAIWGLIEFGINLYYKNYGKVSAAFMHGFIDFSFYMFWSNMLNKNKI